MNNNFLTFIEEDIEAKKTLIATMPIKTKLNKKKYNDKIKEMTKKYTSYKTNVKKYIDTKSKSFEVKEKDKNIDKLTEEVTELERVKFILNPMNNYYSKMGFDNLLYDMSNYTDLDFDSLNDVLDKLLSKFELANIKLREDDFKYTYYVSEYMKAFMHIRNEKKDNYSSLKDDFEKIYWVNSEIIQNIELCFRSLIRKYKSKFLDYINGLKNNIKKEKNIKTYNECLIKLKDAYTKLEDANKETLGDIIKLSKTSEIDINQYFENNKIRQTTFDELMIEKIDPKDEIKMQEFYTDLDKLKENIKEYAKYVEFIPLITYFKNEYEKGITMDKKNLDKDVKKIQTDITKKEAELNKLNKQVFSGKKGLIGNLSQEQIKDLRVKSIHICRELYDMYKNLDKEWFGSKIATILNSTLTIDELLHLYYSFDSFKKIAIKNVFNLTNNDEINKYSDDFDLFSMNPNNVIVDGIEVFQDSSVDEIICNKYRLNNINITPSVLNPDELDTLINKIDMLLRINIIEHSELSVEKIWFMTQVEKFNVAEKKKLDEKNLTT